MQEYADKILRLTTRIELLSKGAATDLKRELVNLQKRAMAILVANPIKTKRELKAVNKALQEVISAHYKEIRTILYVNAEATGTAARAAEIAGYSAAFGNSGIAEKAIKALPIEKIVKSAGNRVMPGLRGRQITVDDMLNRFIENGSKDIMAISSRAFKEGLPVTNIAQMVTESMGVQKNAAIAVARTSIQAIASEAREQAAGLYGAEREMAVATLDAKTCEYCAGLDGKCKEYGTLPDYPAHPNCRCVKLYIPGGISCGDMRADLTRVERGEDGKSRPTQKYESYGEWIKTQPRSFQEAVLGKKRAQMLADGKITFNKMYTQTGRRKTVASMLKHYS